NEELEQFEREDLQAVREAQRRAWDAYRAPIDADVKTALGFIEQISGASSPIYTELQRTQAPFRRDAMRALTQAVIGAQTGVSVPHVEQTLLSVRDWLRKQQSEGDRRYDEHLHSEGPEAAIHVPEVKAEYAD